LGAIVCAAQASNWSHSNPIDRITFDPTSTSQVGLIFGQLAIGVLGVLVMTSEYSTGMIRATFAAIPHRPRVLAAKAAVFGLLALVVGEISTFGAFFAGQAILAGSAPHASLGQANVLRAVIGGGLYLTVLGLMALGIGALIRHSAGAISTFVAVVLILPLLAQALPSSLSHNIIRFLPDAIGQSMSSTIATGRIERFHAFSPWVGFAILCGYAIVLLGLGAWSLTRRDA
ncbi:MAG: ABC transporter permease, partial [Acidimicrobiales bacterium]